jgi:hypothetical protein
MTFYLLTRHFVAFLLLYLGDRKTYVFPSFSFRIPKPYSKITLLVLPTLHSVDPLSVSWLPISN